MGKVLKYIHSEEINPISDEACNRFQVELSHDGIHIHYRNLRIKLSINEAKMWKQAFKYATPYIERQNLL